MTPSLYIIAAGKGSRMGGSLPKALIPITDVPNLTTTLQQIGYKFDRVFVVTNEEIQSPWEKYFDDLRENFPELSSNVENVPIKSGRGDGHAVMEGLKNSYALGNDIFIAWGDVFFPHADIIDEMLSQTMDFGIVPTVREEIPYVGLRLNDKGEVLHADFSKNGEDTRGGHHDQSVFRFDKNKLLFTLEMMDSVLDKDGKYITANGEMSLLHTFHFVSNTSQSLSPEIRAYETSYPTLSFNTVEEVAEIQKEISEKWQHKFRKNQS